MCNPIKCELVELSESDEVLRTVKGPQGMQDETDVERYRCVMHPSRVDIPGQYGDRAGIGQP
jgi:hypothetical protein